MTVTCRRCGATLSGPVPGWCGDCELGARVPARTLLDWLLPDAAPIGATSGRPDPLAWPGYEDERAEAEAATGADESVLAARGQIAGSQVEVVALVWDFGFLGGSMGTAAGWRIVAAYDAATEAGLPIVLLPATGGARMQEGMASLVQMAATTAAAGAHAAAGLLQVAVLRDPSTGGVFASHANLADVVLAEPHATIGFAGPRVSEAVTGGPLPTGSHTAEGAHAAGLVDAVVARPELPRVLARWCGWPGATTPRAMVVGIGERVPTADAWTEVGRARAPERARAPQFLDLLDTVGELHGDRAGEDDPSIRVVAARLAGRPVVVVAMDASTGTAIRPAGYRKAWRGLRLAEHLHVPVVTLIDTPGADASAAAEAGGIAHHIARTFAATLAVRTPLLAVVIGQGGSGGALALAVGDRLLIQEHAIFSVIAPEGAAAILHRDPSRAPEVAALLDPTADRLVALGVADAMIPEPVGAEVGTAWASVAAYLDSLADELELGGGLSGMLAGRQARWRQGWAG